MLVLGAVQSAPAAAAPSDQLYAAVSISAYAVYPPGDDPPGSPGTDINAPADAGPAPGSLRVAYEITNVGTEPLQFIADGAAPVTVGHQDDRECEQPPNEPPIASEDFELYLGQTIHCTDSISGIPDGLMLEDVLEVQAWGSNTGTRASDSTRVWAEVDAPNPPPAPTPSSVGHLVYIDTNHDGQRARASPASPAHACRSKDPTGDHRTAWTPPRPPTSTAPTTSNTSTPVCATR